MPAGRPRRKNLSAKQLRAIRMIVTEGWSGARVAREVPVSIGTFENWKRTPLFIETLEAKLKEHESEIWALLNAHARSAAQTLIDVASDEDEKGSVRVQAAKEILDRTGYVKKEEVVAVANPYQTREELVSALSSLPADVLADAVKASR